MVMDWWILMIMLSVSAAPAYLFTIMMAMVHPIIEIWIPMVMGKVMPVILISWKASVPITESATCAVTATIGTTSTGSVDPLRAIAEVCREYGVWLHVDAAYAGSAAVCPELRHRFAGWERADSIGVNPHKWLFAPMDCSAFFCRRPDDLRRAFSLVPEYLRVDEEIASLSEFSSPLGRRFRSLKLWTALRAHGADAFRDAITRNLQLARELHTMVVAHPRLEPLLGTPDLSIVPFRRVPAHGDVDAHNGMGRIFLGRGEAARAYGEFARTLDFDRATSSTTSRSTRRSSRRWWRGCARPSRRRLPRSPARSQSPFPPGCRLAAQPHIRLRGALRR